MKTNKFGNTLMHFAAEGQDGADRTIQMMDYLFAKHVSLTKKNDRDERPYDIAHEYSGGTLFKNMQYLHELKKY